MAKTKKNIQTEKKRKSYTLDDKAKAKKYYLIGLSILEIGKMIDAPFRTVEKWYIAENWKRIVFNSGRQRLAQNRKTFNFANG